MSGKKKAIIHLKCYKLSPLLLLIELTDERKRAMVLDPGKMNQFVRFDEYSKTGTFNSVTLDMLFKLSWFSFHIWKLDMMISMS